MNYTKQTRETQHILTLSRDQVLTALKQYVEKQKPEIKLPNDTRDIRIAPDAKTFLQRINDHHNWVEIKWNTTEE